MNEGFGGIGICVGSVRSRRLGAACEQRGERLLAALVDFEGAWSESLTYRNYQSNEPVEIHHGRIMSSAEDGCYVSAHLSFNDPGRQVVLVRDEPLAIIIEEALRGFASGRFQTQAEVKRFLEYQPEFPKTRHGTVTNETANRILNRVVYAGMVEREEWGVSLRGGQHEGLITYQEYLQIQERLAAGSHAPARADIDDAFPLRGAVVCADCDHPLTACWSKGRTRRYPYYQCFNTKGACPSARKSIPKDEIEGAFADMLETLTPTQTLFAMVSDMLRNVWDQRAAQAKTIATALKASLVKIDAQVDALVDRIVDADSTAVAKAYEKRLAKLQSERLLLNERLETSGKPVRPFDEVFEPAMAFLANPVNLWRSDRLEDKQTVLKLAFSAAPAYCRKMGFRTPKTSLPFKALGGFSGQDVVMADRKHF